MLTSLADTLENGWIYRGVCPQMIYKFAEFELDLDNLELRSRGEPRPVEPQVFDLLRYLIEHRGRVVSR